MADPVGLSADDSDNIYVVDQGHDRIAIFDSNGNFSTSTIVSNLFAGITVDHNGNIYTTVDGSGKILKIDSHFNIVASTTFANGSFSSDSQTIDPTGNFLYITDYNHGRVIKLNTSDLSFVADTTGPADSPLSQPSALAFDPEGNLYIADYGNSRIVKLSSSPDFNFLSSWGSSGSGNGEFGFIAQMTIDSNGNVYPADGDNNRIQKFTAPTPSPFNIIFTGATTSLSLSYLSVTGSNNQSSFTFDCLIGCVNVGSNINWIFPTSTPTTHRRRALIPTQNNPLVQNTPIDDLQSPLGLIEIPTSTSTATTTVKENIPAISTTTEKNIPISQGKIVNPKEELLAPEIKNQIPKVQENTTNKEIHSLLGKNNMNYFTDSIVSSYIAVKSVIQESYKNIGEIINSKNGSIIVKGIETLGIVFGATISVSVMAFANPITFSEVWMIPGRLFGLFMGAMGNCV